MRKGVKACTAALVAALLAFALVGCAGTSNSGEDLGGSDSSAFSQSTNASDDLFGNNGAEPENASGQNLNNGESTSATQDNGSSSLGGSGSVDNSETSTSQDLLDKDGWYYDVESVVLYIDRFGQLPNNYITKNEARSQGWSGGSVEKYVKGAAIGGDRFGNYEGLLPSNATYTECDIDTDGYSSRGSRRLIFSNKGTYYYTSDHYESFQELTVEDGEAVWL